MSTQRYMARGTSTTPALKGLRQFLTPGQQQAWREGRATPPDAAERSESLELRFKYAARYRKLLTRPQAQDVQDILSLYGRTCLPIPRRTERHYWSVSCLPSTSDKPLARVNASWMELFTLYADGDGVRARFILHLSDFTIDGSPERAHLDEAYLERCGVTREDLYFPSGADIFIVKVRGAEAIRSCLADRRFLRAVRTFNLTHMNRGRNAYQASHCYSLADGMLEG